MGRPWWYDNYWQKDKKPKRSFQIPRRPLWTWLAVVALALILTVGARGEYFSAVRWLLGFIYYVCRILAFSIFLRAILSWFMVSRYNIVVVLLDHISEPILSPLRRAVPRLGMFDITPLIAIAILYAITFIFNLLLT